MAEMGRYCKAYLASNMKQFPGWDPNLDNLRQPEADEPGKEPEKRTELEDDDIVYLQESLIVTDGIFLDENILLDEDKVDEEWTKFCRETLEFEVPEDVQAIGRESEAAAAEAAEAEES